VIVDPNSGTLVRPTKISPVAGALEEVRAEVVRIALRWGAEVFQQERHALERAVGQLAGGLGPRAFEALVDDSVDLRIDSLDASDGRVDQLESGRRAGADEVGLVPGVHPRCLFLQSHHRSFFGPPSSL
jgi:hypothetical protein